MRQSIVLIVIVLTFFSGCNESYDNNTDTTNDVTTSDNINDDWTESSHSNSAEPDYDTVFPQDSVSRIDLTFSQEDWTAMLDDMTDKYGEFNAQGSTSDVNTPPTQGRIVEPTQEENTLIEVEDPIYRPATLTYDGVDWDYVGVRFKGNSTLQTAWSTGNMKLPLRLNLDKFEDDYPSIDNQRFYGFKELSLSSNALDSSLLREKVAADIFREAGVASPQTAFYRIYIDIGDGDGSQYFGLYTMVEFVDDTLVENELYFDDTEGNLYKPESQFITFSEDDFEKKTNEDEADFTDVKSLISILDQTPRDISWRNELESVFNVDGFLNWLAVNTVIQNWDTYGQMAHNHYLYNNSGILNWIPWDNNEALGMKEPFSLDLGSDEVSEQWPLIRYLMDDEEYRATYVEYVARLALEDSAFSIDKMQETYQVKAEMIEPYVIGEDGEREGYTSLSEDFDVAVDFLMDHVEDRQNAISDFLDQNSQ